MVNLMNMTEEESVELIDVLEREHSRLQSGLDRRRGREGDSCDSRRQETIRRLLLKARSGAWTSDLLDPSELIEYRLAGYC